MPTKLDSYNEAAVSSLGFTWLCLTPDNLNYNSSFAL